MNENLFGFASGAGNSWVQYKAYQQDRELHDIEMKVATKHHEEELDNARKWSIKGMGMTNRMHQESMDITKKIYLWDTSTDLSQHFQQLNTDLISANKESDRDMYDQRSAQFQTIIVSATVMFAALCTVIIEGTLPNGCCNEVIEYLMAIFSGLAFAFLFLSIVLSIKVILLSSHFMYIRAQKHNKILRETIEKTSEVLRLLSEIRMKARRTTTTAALNQMFEAHHDQMQDFVTWREKINEAIFRNEGSHLKVPSHEVLNEGRRSFGDADDEGADGEENEEDELAPVPVLRYHVTGEDLRVPPDTRNHQPPLHPNSPAPPRWSAEMTSPRMRSNGRLTKAIFGTPEGTLHLNVTFEQYWGGKCHGFAIAAVANFYLGTSFLLGAIAVFMYAKFLKNYENSSAGWITVGFICLSCVIGGILILLKDDNKIQTCCSRLYRHGENDRLVHTHPGEHVHCHSPGRTNTRAPPSPTSPRRHGLAGGGRGGSGNYSLVQPHEHTHPRPLSPLSLNIPASDSGDMLAPIPTLRRAQGVPLPTVPTATATHIDGRRHHSDLGGMPYEIDLDGSFVNNV